MLRVTFELLQGNEALSLVDGDIGVFSNGGTTPGVPLEFQGETGLLLMCDENVGIPLQTKQRNRPSSRVEEGKLGLFLSCMGNSAFLSSRYGYVGELLELPKGCQVPFRGSRGKVGFLSRRCSGEGPHLALRGESPGFLELRQDTWSSSRVWTGTSGTRSCCLRKVKSPFEL